ncbi:MAG TPA: membrane protein insertion efficiency factor YidD [Geobacteraceae bacterium]|nr:membrane protein insertion efficiency factor YidD [Geobacteraceae bacterium]
MLKRLLITIIVLYQKFISPFLVNTCRFYPSCSQYSKLSLEKHGLFKGLALTCKRLLKCHPFHPGGYDPVP